MRILKKKCFALVILCALYSSISICSQSEPKRRAIELATLMDDSRPVEKTGIKTSCTLETMQAYSKRYQTLCATCEQLIKDNYCIDPNKPTVGPNPSWNIFIDHLNSPEHVVPDLLLVAQKLCQLSDLLTDTSRGSTNEANPSCMTVAPRESHK